MNPLPIVSSREACVGQCTDCGKTHIKVFGAHDTTAQLLRARVMLALEAATLEGKVVEISDPVAVESNGIHNLPALMVEGTVLSEGIVPSVEEIVDLLKNQRLYKSKLFRLRTISVPVDMSPVSANALRFAWKIASQVGANVETVFAMDSIFEGSSPSASGFLSGYQTTMKTELDVFIAESMLELGVKYAPPSKFAGMPSPPMEGQRKPTISSKVIYGAPDLALTEYSKDADLMVMGSTGRGGIGKTIWIRLH